MEIKHNLTIIDQLRPMMDFGAGTVIHIDDVSPKDVNTIRFYLYSRKDIFTKYDSKNRVLHIAKMEVKNA